MSSNSLVVDPLKNPESVKGREIRVCVVTDWLADRSGDVICARFEGQIFAGTYIHTNRAQTQNPAF